MTGNNDLDRCLAEPGRAELVSQVRDHIEELGINYIYYQYISITGRIMGKAVPARHWEEVAEKGVQTWIGGVTNVFADRQGDLIGFAPNASELLALPDPDTFCQLPWNKRMARVFCTCFYSREDPDKPCQYLDGDSRGNLKRIDAAKRVESVLDAILAERDIDPFGQQFLNAGNTAPLRLGVKTPLQHQIGRRIGNHMNLRLAHQINDGIGVILWITGERAGVARRHPALPAMLDSLLGQQFQRTGADIVSFINMHIDISVIFLGDLEGYADMARAILRMLLVERHTADNICARLHCLPHEFFGAVIL